jgi:hypothetical protein
MATTNILSMIKTARETALKNRTAAIAKAAAAFDKEIEFYDKALRQLGNSSPETKSPAKNASKKSTPRKAIGKKKAAPAKKATPSKKSVKATKAAPAAKSSSGYPAKGSVLEKIHYLISQAGRFVSMQQIADGVRKHEPSQKEDAIKRRFSKHIGTFRKRGELASYKTADNMIVYGKPEYLENGKPKSGRDNK